MRIVVQVWEVTDATGRLPSREVSMSTSSGLGSGGSRGRDSQARPADADTAAMAARCTDPAGVRAAMVSGLGTVLGTEVPTDTPLMSVGLDSIAAVEFTNAVSDELGMRFSAVMLFDHPTLDSIVSYLAGEMERDTVGHGVTRAVEGGIPPSSTVTREVALPSLVAVCFNVGGSMSSEAALRALVTRGQATPSGIPSTRWAARASGSSSAAAYGSFLDAAGLRLDGESFGISALEARSMDAQQSLVLHSGYAALISGCRDGSDAGRKRASLVYSGVGAFVGTEPSGLVPRSANVFSATGGSASITSGRLSYVLGLVGPCYTIDTACSSALAALHTCTAALLHRECEEAAAIGTKVLSEAANYGTAVAGMTSLLGRCHTFDARADGYCRGEGCGAYRVCGSRPSAEHHAEESSRDLIILGSAVR